MEKQPHTKRKAAPPGRHAYDRPLWRSISTTKIRLPAPTAIGKFPRLSTGRGSHLGQKSDPAPLPEKSGRIGAKCKVEGGFLVPIEILCVQNLHAEIFLRS